MNRAVIPNAQFFSLVERVIGQGGTLEITVRGTSMRPALENGLHRVVLVPYRGDRRRVGMIALIRYNGKHILHRLVAVEGDTLVFRGDNRPHTVERVAEGDVVALVASIIGPDGRETRCSGRRWALSSRLSVLVSRPRAIVLSGLGELHSRLLGAARRANGDSAPRPGAPRRTRVLFFIESLSGGGAEKILSVIARNIDHERFDVAVRTVTGGGVYADEVDRAVDYRPMIRTRWRPLYTLLYHLIYYVLPMGWVHRLFLPRGADVEVAFCEGFATRLLSRSRARRTIAWVHTDLESNPWTQGLVYRSLASERRAFARFTRVVCVSGAVREAFERRFDLPALTVYNPVDSELIVRRARERTPLPPKTSALRLVSTGRLVDLKGYDRLLRAVARLRDEGHPFELWILGDGPRREALARYIASNRLDDRVTLWGFTPNPYPHVASADLFVCSSRSEGYSTAATEAIILGVPVLTTLVAGMRELLGDNDHGWIVPNDDDALHDALRKIATTPSLLSDLRRRARARSRDFALSAMMAPIENLLSEQ